MAERTIFIDFKAGVVQSIKRNIGRETDEEIRPGVFGQANHLAQLRVGMTDPTLVAEQWSANVSILNVVVGPIDLPFTFNVEQPVEVEVFPAAAPAAAQRVQLILCDLPNPPNLYSATYLPHANEAGNYPIPDWVVAITVYGPPATVHAEFLDPSTATIGTCTGPQLVARPRLAKFVKLVGTGAAVLFHY